MEKKVKLITLGIIFLNIFLVIFIVVTKKCDSPKKEDNVKENSSIVESIPIEKLVIPQNEYNNRLPNPPGIMLEYYEGWERVQIEIVHGEIMLDTKKGNGWKINSVGNKYEIYKDNMKEIYLVHGIEVYEKYEGERLFYAYITFLEDEHIVAQSFVVSREDMENVMNQVRDDSPTSYYASPVKEVKYEKIDGKYQNVTKEYADAWFKKNMEEYEIKKAVETVPEKSRFKITQDYSTDYTKQGNEEETYKANGISIEFELQNENQYVYASTDNGYVGESKETDSWSKTPMKYWLDSENFEKDKYDDRVAYLKLEYREYLKILGLALIKIEYKDDTKTSYSAKVKEVSYEPIDGRSQYISEQTKEAWFERAMSEFEQEITP